MQILACKVVELCIVLVQHEESESKRRKIIGGSMQEYYDHGVQFSIFIRSLEGRTYSIMVTPDTTIHSIKLLLKRKGFVQCVRTWWLCYGGKKLPDDSMLPDHGIQKDCTLCVQVSFLGAGEVFARASC